MPPTITADRADTALACTTAEVKVVSPLWGKLTVAVPTLVPLPSGRLNSDTVRMSGLSDPESPISTESRLMGREKFTRKGAVSPGTKSTFPSRISTAGVSARVPIEETPSTGQTL